MEKLLLISLTMLWVLVLISLALLFRVLRWLHAMNEAKVEQDDYEEVQELIIGAPAPEFKARTLTGQAARLDDYAGRAVAFIFVSPACGHCRLEMPMLIKLAPLAKKNAEVELVLVSDWGPVVTRQWLDTMRTEDGVDVTLPVLVAPPKKSDFLNDYNTGQITPGFCVLDAESKVQAKGHIPSAEWNKLKRSWEGITKLSPLQFSQYR